MRPRYPVRSRPDMVFAVDWALKKQLSIYLSTAEMAEDEKVSKYFRRLEKTNLYEVTCTRARKSSM